MAKEFEERTDWQMFGFDYSATKEQANRVFEAVAATPEWLEWATLDTLFEAAHIRDRDLWLALTKAAERKADLHRQLMKKVALEVAALRLGAEE